MLKAFHYPVTVTVVQFAVGTVLVAFMWGLNLYKRPKLSGAMVILSDFIFVLYISVFCLSTEPGLCPLCIVSFPDK